MFYLHKANEIHTTEVISCSADYWWIFESHLAYTTCILLSSLFYLTLKCIYLCLFLSDTQFLNKMRMNIVQRNTSNINKCKFWKESSWYLDQNLDEYEKF